VIRRIRLGFVVVICVVLQTTLFTHLRVDGVAPEVGLVAVLAVAYYDGAESGALYGFLMGFAMDLFLTTPLGLSALSYAITAYGVGLLQAGMVRRPPFIAPLIGGLGGFVGGLVFLAVGAVVGEAGFLSLSSLKTVTIAALYDALIAPVVFPLVRRAARHTHEAAWRVAP
jgi:rod shape-determining protein MreD